MAGPERRVSGKPARLDTPNAAPETSTRAKGASAVSDSESSSGAAAAAARLLDKVQTAAGRLVQSRAIAQQAQVREALTRTELTLALNQALIGRAEARARLRVVAFDAYRASRRPGRLRRRGKLSRNFEQLLARLGAPGKALVIARAGVWRGTGRLLFDLRHMAAYARRGAHPQVPPPALFDQAWYLETYPDVVAAGASPLAHYLLEGGDDDRSPHPLFDVAHYRRENGADLTATGVTPLEHFVRRGAALGRNPHPLFDIAYYIAQSPDLQPGEDPLSHYLRIGWTRELAPHPLIDPAWYRQRAPRAARHLPPLLHYVEAGWRQGLSPHPLFDPRWYLEQNPDIAQAGDEPLSHFLLHGAAEGRSPSPWFDLRHYLAVRGDALAPGSNPLIDYLQGGAWAVAEPRPGFPTAAYLAATPELVRDGITPLEHWARRQAG